VKTWVLADSRASFVIDASGAFREIRGPDGLEFGRPGEATGWEMITTLGSWREHPVPGQRNAGDGELAGNHLRLMFPAVTGLDGARLLIRVLFEYRLEEGQLSVGTSIWNDSAETVCEVRLPFVSGFSPPDSERENSLVMPIQLGRKITNPTAALPKDWESWYHRPPGRGFYHAGGIRGQCVPTWPGVASMPWMDFSSAAGGIYFGAHECGARNVGLLARGRRLHGDIQLGFAKYPFLQPGGEWHAGPFVIYPHSGDWHEGSRAYRSFAETRGTDSGRPAWVRDASGLRVVLMKHQNGKIHRRYEDLPDIHRADLAADLHVPILVFSWFRSGHDNGYPVCYEPDPAMGGEPALRKALADIRNAGGHVILYTQGQLIDMAAEYWRSGPGQAVCRKNREGVPYYEEWSFLGEGTVYPGKLFALGCPGTVEWHSRLAGQLHGVRDLGAAGILLDQFGGTTAHLCFDGAHRHDTPDSCAGAKIPLLRSLHKEAAAHDPEFAIIGEHVCDVFLEHLDLTHGNATAPEGPDDHTDCSIFRYTFPHLRITSRSAVTYDKIHCAFVHGLVPEIPDTANPGYWMPQAVLDRLKALVRLRQMLGDFLIRGTFLDDSPILACRTPVRAKVFRSETGSRLAVVLWNPADRQTISHVVLNHPPKAMDAYFPGRDHPRRVRSARQGLRIRMPANGIAVVVG
jgi:hypothetical protein